MLLKKLSQATSIVSMSKAYGQTVPFAEMM